MNLALPLASCKVPTPTDLAAAMVSALGDRPDARWLEPSHGTGVFLRAVANVGVPKRRLVAVDLDPNASASDRLAQTLRRIDFLHWAQTTDLRFDRIIGNPPYVSIKRLSASLRKTAANIKDFDGNPIGTGSNVWYGFVVSAIRLLNEGGSLAFVLPSAAEFAHYTSEIRESLKNSFASLEIFRCKKSLFDNVQEGTVVAIARGFGTNQTLKYRRREFADRQSLISALSNSTRFVGKTCPANCASSNGSTNKFRSIANIRLGGVTGDARYFLMNDERRKELQLPEAAMTPVVSKAKQLRSAVIDKNYWEGLKEEGQRIWLFDPKLDQLNEKAIKAYLKLDSALGGCKKDAFKISTRDRWYKVPLPQKADAFISGMSQRGPLLTINEMKGLNATNTLYVVTFNEGNTEDWYKWSLAMLTTSVQKQIQRIGRRYADGLIKYEPGAIGEIVLPKMRDGTNFRTLYQKAINFFLASDLKTAKSIADSVRS